MVAASAGACSRYPCYVIYLLRPYCSRILFPMSMFSFQKA
nr:MAG TPA: hypothetical protein [Caudoviricetes sp.]